MKKLTLILVMLLLTGCVSAPGGGYTNGPDQQPQGVFPGLGGVMPDMTFQTADGRELTLYGLLEEKQLVVLNFWFEGCTWCLKEFPVMELAYQEYRQDVEIVDLNPSDGMEAIREFQEKRSLSFPMAPCRASTAREAGVSAYPTSIFIDRDGVVCLIHVGAITKADDFRAVFTTFTGEDYTCRVYGNIREILN
jgi:thiol-disulfide isomerase/thioredoxin